MRISLPWLEAGEVSLQTDPLIHEPDRPSDCRFYGRYRFKHVNKPDSPGSVSSEDGGLDYEGNSNGDDIEILHYGSREGVNDSRLR